MSKTVLVVEDDEPTQRLIATLLHRAGLSTVSITRGDTAAAALRKRDYAAAIVDLSLPGLPGREIIDLIAAERLNVPVVVCTANRWSPEDFPDGAVRAVIRKPFDIDQFVATIVAVAGGGKLPRILIVEDEEHARYILRSFVEPAQVLEAETAEEAMQMIASNPPDLVLLDLMLPGKQGEDLLVELRSDPKTADLPVIVVTNRQLTRDEQQSLMDLTSGVIEKRNLSRSTFAAVLQLAFGEANGARDV